jgi:hypothetical protein
MKSSKGLKYENRFTRKSFIQYKESMEKFLTKVNSEKIYNINENGIPINGLKNKDLNYFISKYCARGIDKQSVINKELDKATKSGQILSCKKLRDLIQKKNIFNEVLNASMDTKTAEKKSRNLYTLLKNA